VVATGLAKSKAALLLIVIGLPMAVMPAYLTLTHPLEAMLILLALAAQAEGTTAKEGESRGGKAQALALMAVCLFVKPSMAYVYGFLLLVMIAWDRRRRPTRFFLDLVPAIVALVLVISLLGMRFGLLPVAKTLLPITGAKTYASTGFGFFTASGRAFWITPELWRYILAPSGIFLVAAIATAVGALRAGIHLLRHEHVPSDPVEISPPRRAWELLFTVGVLHTSFLLGFYGWTGSWTYYSYLPVLGLALCVQLLVRQPCVRAGLFVALTALMLLSHALLVILSADAWRTKSPHGEQMAGAEEGLWRYPFLWQDWKEVVNAIGPRKALAMTNGYLFDLPENIQMPDAWFPEPGIPTSSEVARVKNQIEHVDMVVLWNEYGPQPSHPDLRLWAFPELSDDRRQFAEDFTTTNGQFTVLRRVRPATSSTATSPAASPAALPAK